MQTKRQLLPLHGLRAFEAIARQNAMSEAADELGVTQSAMSQQLKKLEDLLDARLFDRQFKPLRLTAEGKQLLGAVTQALDLMARATSEIQSGEIEGDLTVSCVPGLAANWFVPILGEFLEAHPKIRIRVVTDLWSHPIKLEDVDLAIGYGNANHPGKRVVHLGHPAYFPVCSPTLIGQESAVRHASDLLNFNLLHAYDKGAWSRWFAGAGVLDARPRQEVVFDTPGLSMQAARAGYGVALSDAVWVRNDLASGALIRLSDFSIATIEPYHIITPPADLLKPTARMLEQWLVDRYQG